MRALRVPCPSQACDRVEEDQHVGAVLDHAFGLLEDHLRHLDVPGGRLIEGRTDDLAILPLDLPLHVGDFFRTLVDQEHEDIQIGIVVQRGLGHLLHEDRLAGARRTDDQPALPESHRHDHVDDARFDIGRRVLHHHTLIGVQGRQVVEEDLARQQVGILVVDRLHAQQGEVALVLLGRPNLTRYRRPRAQPKTPNLAGRHVDIVGAGQVVVVRTAQEAETVGQDLQRSFPVHQPIELHAFLENLENQVLPLHAGIVDEVLLARLLNQLAHRQLLQFGDVRITRLLDRLVALVGIVVRQPAFFHQLLGQRERLAIEGIVQVVVHGAVPRVLGVGRTVILRARRRAPVGSRSRPWRLGKGHGSLLLKGSWDRHAEGAGGGLVDTVAATPDSTARTGRRRYSNAKTEGLRVVG